MAAPLIGKVMRELFKDEKPSKKKKHSDEDDEDNGDTPAPHARSHDSDEPPSPPSPPRLSESRRPFPFGNGGFSEKVYGDETCKRRNFRPAEPIGTES